MLESIQMKQLIFSSDGSYLGLLLRVTAGAIMLPHGAQKMIGLFGGYGFKPTMDYFTQTMGLPWIISFLVIIIEFAGALSLIFGFASKIWALAFIAVMIGAIMTTSYKNGFFMNWFGNQSGEGYEFHLLMIAICIGVVITGSGKYALDNMFNR